MVPPPTAATPCGGPSALKIPTTSFPARFARRIRSVLPLRSSNLRIPLKRDRGGHNRYLPRPSHLACPLKAMSPPERLAADYDTLHLTTGPHPMAYIRASLPGIPLASELATRRHGEQLTIAGLVICRQRPGTAKGHMFISLEDESGISNAFVPSKTFEAFRLVITQEPFLKIHGTLQIVDGVTSVYTQRVEALPFGSALDTKSHDFH